MTELEHVCDGLVDAGAQGALALVGVDRAEREAAVGAMSPGERFRAGSVTKTAVAALVLLLAEDGRLELDEPADAWVVAAPAGITVRALLQHTSGLPDFFANPDVRDRFLREPEAAWHPEELIELAGPASPADAFAYSNTNYVVLGLLAEAVGGAPLARQLAGRIFEPLGLHRTELRELAGAAAAGGLVSTAADIARFLRGLLGGGLLAPALLEEMLTTIPGDGVEFTRYGLGIAEMDSFMGLVPSPCGSAWGHLGFLPDCTCAALSTRDGRRQAVLVAAGSVREAFGEAMWEIFCEP